MKTLATFSGRGTFSYEGSVTEGVTVEVGYGKKARQYWVSKDVWRCLLHKFQGQELLAGCSWNAPEGSVGRFIQDNSKAVFGYRDYGMMGYYAAILIEEGYAERSSRPRHIRFHPIVAE